MLLILILGVIITISSLFLTFFTISKFKVSVTKPNTTDATKISEFLGLISAIITLIASIVSISVSSTEVYNNHNFNQNNNNVNNTIVIENSKGESINEVLSNIKSSIGSKDYEELAYWLNKDCVSNRGECVAYKGIMCGKGLYYQQDFEKAEQLLDESYNLGYNEANAIKLCLFLDFFQYEKALTAIENGISNNDKYIISFVSQFENITTYNNFSPEQKMEFLLSKMCPLSYIGTFTYNSIQNSTNYEKYVRVSSSINTTSNGQTENAYTYQLYKRTYSNRNLIYIGCIKDL